jgi:hypothetical protein
LDFDAKIANLATITKHCPKLVIDSIMLWRQDRSKPADEFIQDLQ